MEPEKSAWLSRRYDDDDEVNAERSIRQSTVPLKSRMHKQYF
jgi:hypothetical protein